MSRRKLFRDMLQKQPEADMYRKDYFNESLTREDYIQDMQDSRLLTDYQIQHLVAKNLKGIYVHEKE